MYVGVPEHHKNTIAKVKTADKCLICVMSIRKDKEIIPTVSLLPTM